MGILPVQHLYVFKVLRLFYLRSGNMGTTNLLHYTRSNTQRHFQTPKVNKSIYRKSFQYNGPKYFNNIPHDIKTINNLKSFSKNIMFWLFHSVILVF